MMKPIMFLILILLMAINTSCGRNDSFANRYQNNYYGEKATPTPTPTPYLETQETGQEQQVQRQQQNQQEQNKE
jgi:hypothetical protein